MKMAYVYQESKDISKANVYQAVSMVSAFSEIMNVDWYHGWLKIQLEPSKYHVNQVRTINFGLNQKGSFQIEKISRILFVIHTLLRLHIKKVDLIYTRDPAFLLAYSYLPKWMKVKCPIIYESHKVYNRVSEKVNKDQEFRAISNANIIVAITNGVKDDLIEDYNINPDCIHVLPNGIKLIPGSPKEIQERKIKKFVYAGSLIDWKGVPVIIEASKLLKDFDGEIHIIGGTQEEHESLQSGAPDFVHFIPSLDRQRLYTLLNTMDVGIIPTLDHLEGGKYTSPIKFLEYVQCGLSVLASDSDALKELNEQGFNVDYFEVGNAQDLADKIRSMVNLPLNMDRIKSNLQHLNSFTWDKRTHDIVHLVK